MECAATCSRCRLSQASQPILPPEIVFKYIRQREPPTKQNRATGSVCVTKHIVCPKFDQVTQMCELTYINSVFRNYMVYIVLLAQYIPKQRNTFKSKLYLISEVGNLRPGLPVSFEYLSKCCILVNSELPHNMRYYPVKPNTKAFNWGI